jgi:hypothetical protein
MGLGRFRVGTLCSGTFCSWDVSRLGHFVWGRFVGAPNKRLKNIFKICRREGIEGNLSPVSMTNDIGLS